MRSIQWHLFIRFGQRRRRETQKDRSKEESKSVTYSIVRNALLLYWCDEALIHTACHSYIPHSAMFRLNIVSFSVGLRGPRHGGGWRAIHRHRHRQNILFILVRMPRVEKKQIAKNARLVFIMAANLSPVLLGSFIWGAFTQFNSIRFINVNPFRQPHSHCPLNIQFATLLFFFRSSLSPSHSFQKNCDNETLWKRKEASHCHHVTKALRNQILWKSIRTPYENHYFFRGLTKEKSLFFISCSTSLYFARCASVVFGICARYGNEFWDGT